MKKTTLLFKNLALLAGLILGSYYLIGCGKGKDGGSAGLACPPGSAFLNGACVNGQGQFIQNPGFGYTNGFYADTYSGTSQLRLNGSAMQQFFKFGMGVCDRAGGANGGLSSCNAYASGSMDMIIQFPPNGGNSLLATFIAQPRVSPYYNYNYQLPSGWGALGVALGLVTGIFLPDPKQYYGAYRNPLQVEMPISLINNSAGFSANANLDFYVINRPNFMKLTIEVPQGKIEDPNLRFVFKVNDAPAAQGIFSRCRRQNCGL